MWYVTYVAYEVELELRNNLQDEIIAIPKSPLDAGEWEKGTRDKTAISSGKKKAVGMVSF